MNNMCSIEFISFKNPFENLDKNIVTNHYSF